MTDYDPATIASDATAFAESRFGKHYLQRLTEAKERALRAAMNVELTDSQRAHAGTEAAVYEAEFGYFQTAQTITKDSSMLKRLRDGFQKRLAKENGKEVEQV